MGCGLFKGRQRVNTQQGGAIQYRDKGRLQDKLSSRSMPTPLHVSVWGHSRQIMGTKHSCFSPVIFISQPSDILDFHNHKEKICVCLEDMDKSLVVC